MLRTKNSLQCISIDCTAIKLHAYKDLLLAYATEHFHAWPSSNQIRTCAHNICTYISLHAWLHCYASTCIFVNKPTKC